MLVCLGFGPLFACALIDPPDLVGDLGLKAAPDWSRGLHVGSEFYGLDSGAPLVVDDRGRVHLLWTLRLSANDYDLRYLRLDGQGLVEEEHDLNVGLYEPRRVRLLLGSDQLIHVFLLGLEDRGEPSSLFHLTVTRDGSLDGAPALVSSGRSACHEYDVTADSVGKIHLFWTEGLGRERDLFYSALGPGEETTGARRVITRGVSHPVARTDSKGRIHFLWEEPGEDEETAELYHAVLTGELAGTLSGVKLLDLPTGVRFTRHGPVLALDDEYAYVVWTQKRRVSRMAASEMEGWYGSYALDSPSAVSARSFSLPMDEKPVYVDYDAPHSYEHLVPSGGDAELGSDRITEPSPLISAEEAMVTSSMTVMHRMSRESQIINAVFADGSLVGYQLACNTSHWSRLSNLASDSEGDLHLSWVDGLEPGPSEVYYATTSPPVRTRVDHINLDDLLFAALNTAFSAVAGVPMIPFVVLWIIPPLIWVFIFSRFLGARGAPSARGYLGLLVTVVIYQVSKLYFNPGLLEYVPFSVSVPFLPAYLYGPVQVVVPLGIAGLGLIGALYTLLRVETRSLVTTSLTFLLIDAFLTIMIYGPSFARL